MNKTGMNITTDNNGIIAVLDRNCFIGMRDEAAKINGIMQITNNAERLKIKRDATIMKTIKDNLTNGFIDCNSPRLLLKSSIYTKDSIASTTSLSDCGTFISF
jgi:hypothetical protein